MLTRLSRHLEIVGEWSTPPDPLHGQILASTQRSSLPLLALQRWNVRQAEAKDPIPKTGRFDFSTKVETHAQQSTQERQSWCFEQPSARSLVESLKKATNQLQAIQGVSWNRWPCEGSEGDRHFSC